VKHRTGEVPTHLASSESGPRPCRRRTKIDRGDALSNWLIFARCSLYFVIVHILTIVWKRTREVHPRWKERKTLWNGSCIHHHSWFKKKEIIIINREAFGLISKENCFKIPNLKMSNSSRTTAMAAFLARLTFPKSSTFSSDAAVPCLLKKHTHTHTHTHTHI